MAEVTLKGGRKITGVAGFFLALALCPFALLMSLFCKGSVVKWGDRVLWERK